ncbi:MAG TPA: phospholipase D-like domain-containing protein [bacterium]|nr:phospholipase D-like domain-containing protein [bacterium]
MNFNKKFNDKYAARFLCLIAVFLAIILILNADKLHQNYELLTAAEQIQEMPTANANQKNNYSVLPLIDKEYYNILLNEISAAENSIDVIMYIIEKHAAVKKILDALIAKKKQGLRVRVIVSDADKTVNPALYDCNNYNVDYLNLNGVTAMINKNNSTTHDKLILIDNKTLIIGAHNWSYSALFRSSETSLLIKAENDLIAAIDYIESFYK